MSKQNTSIDPRSKNLRSWLMLVLRWLLGGLAGIGISSWIYFGLKSDTFTGPFLWLLEMLPILSVPFVGHIYLFYPGTIHFPVNYYFITFPVLIWGLIGALIASGMRNQIIVGTVFLTLYVVVGFFSYFLAFLRIPT